MTEPLRAIDGERVEVREPRFKLIRFEGLTPGASPSCLVKNLIPRVGLTVAWGPPKCGKSFWAYDLAMHVALGWEYRGRRVQQGPVVDRAFEGAEGFKARAEAFRQRFLAEDALAVPFYLSPTPMDLIKDHAAFIASIRVHLDGAQPIAIVLDTLNRSLHGSESDDADMTAYIRAADVIRDAFSCAILIVHHCGVEGTRPRGHTALAGAVDAQIAVTRDSENNIIVTVERMKDGPEGETETSRLEIVEVGFDTDGDPITSCVVLPAEAKLSGKVSGQRALTGRRALIFNAVVEAVDTFPGQPPASNYIPAGIPVTSRANVMEIALRKGFADPDKPDSARAQFSTVLRDLIGSGYLASWNDGFEGKGTAWLWIPR